MSLENRCEVCEAEPGQPCVYTLNRVNTRNPVSALPGGRLEHYARALAPDDTARRRKAKTCPS